MKEPMTIVVERSIETKELVVPAEKIKNQDFMDGMRMGLNAAGLRFAYIGDDMVVGACEACQKVLLETDRYFSCQETGVDLCIDCGNQLRESAE